MQILVADESRAVRALTRSALLQTRFAGDGVRAAEAGDQVTSWIHMRPPGPAYLIADWDLPGMDGARLMGCLHELRLVDEIGVLFSINRAQIPLAEAAVERGARGYIVRPFTDEEFRTKIESMAAQDLPARSSAPSDILRDIVTSVRARQDLPTLLCLPSGVISELYAGSTRVRTLAGETLVWPGQHVSNLSFILAGEVEVTSTLDDRSTRRGAGECFAERAFVCGEPSRVRVKARTAVELIEVPKVRMVELARRHASVRTFLTALLDLPMSAATPECELSGSLASLPFAGLIQFLHASRKTGLLLLDGEDGQGVLYFSQGEAHDAQFGGSSGESAFFELSGWKRGRFEFRSGESQGQRTLERPTLRMLVDVFARPEVAEPAA